MELGINTEVIDRFKECFSGLEDPRREHGKLYPMEEIFFLLLVSVICGADSFRSCVDYAESRLSYLRRFYPYVNGIPQKTTLQRILCVLNPASFRECFLNWVAQFKRVNGGVIAIDGKTLCGSVNKSSDCSPIHIVSAFASNVRLVLGQEKVSGKSNEITAIPKLLDLLELSGTIVTIDAMGCQKKIAEQIKEKGGDYLLGLKGNQGNLHKEVGIFLEKEAQNPQSNRIKSYEEINKGHGRIEIKRCIVSDDLSEILFAGEWKYLNSIVMIESTRMVDEKQSTEKRLYISSLPADAKLINHAVREHWSIENNLHWNLDVTFREDDSQIRDDNVAENSALLRKIALNILHKAKGKFKNLALKRLIKKAGWDEATLNQILFHGL